MTPAELDVLNLGYAVRQEQQEQANDNAARGRKYTQPAETTSEAMASFPERVKN